MKREKIGDRYFRAGYGRTSPRKANVYLIDGFAYAKDKNTAEDSFSPLKGELQGYVRVNSYVNQSTGLEGFFQVSNHGKEDKHLPYTDDNYRIGDRVRVVGCGNIGLEPDDIVTILDPESCDCDKEEDDEWPYLVGYDGKDGYDETWMRAFDLGEKVK